MVGFGSLFLPLMYLMRLSMLSLPIVTYWALDEDYMGGLNEDSAPVVGK